MEMDTHGIRISVLGEFYAYHICLVLIWKRIVTSPTSADKQNLLTLIQKLDMAQLHYRYTVRTVV